MSIRYPGASERGGLRGPMAPPPHDPAFSPHEQIRLVYATEPTDATDTVEKQYQEELKRAKG